MFRVHEPFFTAKIAVFFNTSNFGAEDCSEELSEVARGRTRTKAKEKIDKVDTKQHARQLLSFSPAL